MHELEVLRSAVVEFDRRLELVAETQWGLPTPCQEWTVRDLVGHVIGGNRLALLLLEGATSDQALSRLHQDDRVTSPLIEVRRSADAMLASFTEHGALARVCHHPADRITGRDFAVYRAGDIAVHAWDLARALGADENLDPDLVEATRTSYVPWVMTLSVTSMFGPELTGDLPADASPQQRLLGALGRRP